MHDSVIGAITRSENCVVLGTQSNGLDKRRTKNPAVRRRRWRPRDAGRIECVLVHWDQGSPYGSVNCLRFCEASNIEPSIGVEATAGTMRSLSRRSPTGRMRGSVNRSTELALSRVQISSTMSRCLTATPEHHSQLGGVIRELFPIDSRHALRVSTKLGKSRQNKPIAGEPHQLPPEQSRGQGVC